MKNYSILMILGAVVIVGACGASATAGIPSTPDGTVLYVTQHVADGHPEVLWEALPASYQSDIAGLTHDFAAKIDAEAWNKTFAVSGKAIKLLQDKKELFFQTSLFNMAGDKKNEIAANWDTATLALGTLIGSDVSDLEKLKTIDWKAFLATTGADLMELSRKASAATEENSYETEFLAKARGLKVEVKENQGDTATLMMTSPDEEPEELKMTRIEGRWVPNDLSDDWKKDVADARLKIDKMTPETMAQQKVQYMMGLAMAEGLIDQLAQAQTPEQLEQMLGGIFGMFMGGHGQGSDQAPVAPSDS